MISIEELTVRHGSRTLFADATIQFNPGSRYGLVGANGSGKSTLLRIMMGDEPATTGAVNRPSAARIGYLVQDHYRHEQDRILDCVLMGRERLWAAMCEKDALLNREGLGEAEGLRLAALEELIAAHDGYAAEGEAGAILEGLGIPTERHPLPLSSLSGGFKLRVLLGRLLFSRPDVLLLDEPTNHLDIVSIRWLEEYLEGCEASVLVASHDRQFLDNICTHMVDIDYGAITLYAGNYTAFVAKKQLDRDQKEAAIDKQDKRRDELERFITRFKAKATKAKQAQSKAKQIEKMDDLELPRTSRRWPQFSFGTVRHSGVTPLKVEGIDKAFGENVVLRGVGFELAREDRVALIGPNGIGKSTLLKILMGQVAPDAGKFTWGYETHVAYFPQDHREQVTGNHTLESWLWQFGPGATIGKIRGLLGRSLFSGDDAEKKIDVLSGGESGRLLLARLMLVPHNVLVLDEPTNHLDLEAIDQLAGALHTYPGTIVFVSHNRHFVGKIANRVIELTPDGLRDHRGSYAEYLEQYGRDYLDRGIAAKHPPRADAAAGGAAAKAVATGGAAKAPASVAGGPRASGSKPSAPKAAAAPARPPSKAALNLRRKADALESEVARLEAECARRRGALEQLTPDLQLERWSELSALERTLEQAFTAWESATRDYEAAAAGA